MRLFAIAALVAVASVACAQELTIARPQVSQSEDGAPLAAGETFVPGETVFFSFEVAGYKPPANGKVQLKGHVQAFDPRGTAIAVEDEQSIATTLAEEDKNWRPKIRSQFVIPSIAPPGTYRVRFNVADPQGRAGKGEATFAVKGHSVEASRILAVKNLGFYRTQDDEVALREPLYSAGDTLWVRLDVTGYKYGEQNSIDVSYDVEVDTADGKTLFQQADAAVERSQSFYPQPWVPAEFNLSLQPTMSKGPYTLIITAHDGTGKSTATAKAEFRVQ